MSRLEFDRIDLTDFVIIVALSIGLIMSVYLGQKELSMSIVSGMFGYVGGSYTKQGNKNNNSNVIQSGSTKTTTTNTTSVVKSDISKN